MFSANVYADNSTDRKIKNYFITITDPDGNIVYAEELSRATYINGTQYDLNPGYTFTTYQYYPSSQFCVGFLKSTSTQNTSLTLGIYNSATIGRARSYVTGITVNTSTAYQFESPSDDMYLAVRRGTCNVLSRLAFGFES